MAIDMKFTNDLVIENGDIALVRDEFAIGQAIRDRLATFRGEWFLDTQFGPDYRADILKKNPPLFVVSAVIKDEILKTQQGTFTEFEVKYTTDRTLSVNYTLDTTGGVVSDTIVI